MVMKTDIDRKTSAKAETLKYIYYVVICLITSVVQVNFLNIIAIEGMTPDLLLILVIYIAIREGQFKGIFAGFAIGLIFDIVSLDLVGTNALAKTTAGFIAGFFYIENQWRRYIATFRFLIIVFATSLVHNLIYFFFYLQPSEMNFWGFGVKYGLAISSYTSVISIFVLLFSIPKRRFGE